MNMTTIKVSGTRFEPNSYSAHLTSSHSAKKLTKRNLLLLFVLKAIFLIVSHELAVKAGYGYPQIYRFMIHSMNMLRCIGLLPLMQGILYLRVMVLFLNQITEQRAIKSL